VQDFNRGKAFQLQTRVQRPQRPQHIRIVAERQGGVQPPDDVQFGDAELQRFARFRDDFLEAELKAIRVPLLAGEGAELAAQDAVVRVIDVTVQDVAGPAADLALAGQAGDGAQRVQVFAFKKAERVGFGNPLAGGDLVIQVAQFAALNKEMHSLPLPEAAALATGFQGSLGCRRKC